MCLLGIFLMTLTACLSAKPKLNSSVGYQPDFPLPVKVTTTSPEEINQIASSELWDGLLKMGVSNFYHRADTYTWDPWCCAKGTQKSKECQIVYGALAPEDFWGYVPKDYWFREPGCDPGEPNNRLKKILFSVMKSDHLMTLTYQWLSPYYKETFLKLTPESQQIYLEALTHAQEYLLTFDYKKELAYLEKIKAENLKEDPECADPTYGFAYSGPDGKTKFRKVEAFIFRRVHNHDMTVERLKKWADILMSDTKELLKSE